eukprot:TRINITY_DN23187_c0_g1_i1.p1 TRINITY_DN23187_c0_g1~~TRINITY_DN23187_c0_g1_i1.p1  ORF type:complete len:454 (-),score=109.09 TRINITY_DN23187_c0_g1_i1:23-1354(-)
MNLIECKSLRVLCRITRVFAPNFGDSVARHGSTVACSQPAVRTRRSKQPPVSNSLIQHQDQLLLQEQPKEVVRVRRSKRQQALPESDEKPQQAAAAIAKEPPDYVLGLDVNSRSTGFVVLDRQGRMIEGGVVDTLGCGSVYDKALVIRNLVEELQSKYNEMPPHTTSPIDLAVSRTDFDMAQLEMPQLPDSSRSSNSGLRIVRGHTEQSLPPVRKAAPAAERTGVRWLVAVEDFLLAFGGVRFRTKDLFTLAQLNSLVSYDCMHLFGSLPTRIHPRAARSSLGIRSPYVKKKLQPPAAPVIDVDAKPVSRTKTIKAGVFDLFARRVPANFGWLRSRTGHLTAANYDAADAYVVARYAYTAEHPSDDDAAPTVGAKRAKKAIIPPNVEPPAPPIPPVAELNKLARGELQRLAKLHQLPATGTNAQLVARLQQLLLSATKPKSGM